jgi:transposase-like protein
MGLGLKAVGRAVGCHHTTVLKWVRRFADEHRAKPVPRSELSLGAAELARLLRSDECGKARKRVAELSAAGAGSAVPPLLKGCVTDTAD